MHTIRLAAFAATSFIALVSGTSATAQNIKHAWWAQKGAQGSLIPIPNDISTDTNGLSTPVLNAGNVVLGFEGISQYDNAAFARNFIPPDTMGAVGMTQYLESSNGAFAVFDKATGTRTQLLSDLTFWSNAGQTGANGDNRVMYNAAAQRWIVVGFGANVADLQIAISDTDNAMGSWKSVKFTGFAGGTADYPTLALDRNAVYIGTNNFRVGCNPGNPSANAFCGTTLNVVPLDSLFNAGAPTVANMKQFVTPFVPGSPSNQDRGFAIQGVNSDAGGSTGKAVAASLFAFDSIRYDITGLTPGSATGAAEGSVIFLNEAGYTTPGPGRQPSVAIAANRRIIDTLDERISSSVYEVNGRIYMLHTVDSGFDALDEARVRVLVFDSATNAKLDEFDIGQAGYDYYQGSIAVDSGGHVMIGYNRSGLDPATGKISFFARAYATNANGTLTEVMAETLLKESLTDDYHNGSLFGQPAAGRQRWGDYSQVSVDPADGSFWLIGQFAREYNLPQFGHPGGTGGSRWGTWIAHLGAVPEPATWAMMIAGFGMVGSAMRRGRRISVTYA